MPTVQTLYDELNQRFPFARAESWDKVGLLVGDRGASVARVLVAYEVTEDALDAARAHSCEAVVAYHPLIFRPLERLDFCDRTASLCARLIREERHLICVHTALDGAPPPNALGDALARQLGIEGAKVGKPSGAATLCQLVYFVPPAHLDATRDAAWRAGAGTIGLYDEASFVSSGSGTYRPLPGASPSDGTVGVRSQTSEVRVELLVRQSEAGTILRAIQRMHPYEEVAHFLVPLDNAPIEPFGPLRLAKLAAGDEATLPFWIERAKERLGVPSVRVVAPRDVQTFAFAACSPGSGASFIASLPRGTVFVSGDFKHHDALLAQSRGVALVDVTHAATERATIEMMSGVLERVEGLEVVRDALRNPFDFA